MEFTNMMRAFNRDWLLRVWGLTPTVDGFYTSPSRSQDYMPVEEVGEVRYDIIGECEICGEDYDKYRHSQRYCSPECRKEVKKRYEREYDARPERMERRRERIDDVKTAGDAAFATPDPYTNLMLAIAQSAQGCDDNEWLKENADLYHSAILGKPMEDFYGKET